MTDRSPARPVAVGAAVPEFTLTDQRRARVSLSQLRGRVVALNFIYTSCALPQFCYRTTNHFGTLQRRLQNRLGRDVVLLTITFDPVRDTPERLASYAAEWKADAQTWHFLTGDAAAVQRVCDMFGVDFFPDEGLMSHSVHTAVIDRQGRLVANIEGNQFTSTQLASSWMPPSADSGVYQLNQNRLTGSCPRTAPPVLGAKNMITADAPARRAGRPRPRPPAGGPTDSAGTGH